MRSVDIWLEQTDEFILQSLNPCPEVVQDKEAFVRQVHYTHIQCRVADPDPNWIRIQSGQWIRIRIRNPDPDLGGQK
jgi:hypothetical protein